MIVFGLMMVLAFFGGTIFLYRTIDSTRVKLSVIENTLQNQQSHNYSVSIDTQPISSEFREYSNEIKKELHTLPEDILRALTGSANAHKGKLGELIGYISLKAQYDKIIPIGSIVDFVCLKFPKENEPGKIVFIDIKTGKNARLNTDQKILKKIIESKNVEFKKIEVDDIDVLDVDD